MAIKHKTPKIDVNQKGKFIIQAVKKISSNNSKLDRFSDGVLVSPYVSKVYFLNLFELWQYIVKG